MSFNFACRVPVPDVTKALRFAHRRGIVLVASVGNEGSETCVSPPATEPHVIGVGGTTEGACLGWYSLTGDKVDLVAPGGGFRSSLPCSDESKRPVLQVTLRPGTTNLFGIPHDYVGTSMSAAHVSGVAALILADRRLLGRSPDPDAVTARLESTARDLGAGRGGPGLRGRADRRRRGERPLGSLGRREQPLEPLEAVSPAIPVQGPARLGLEGALRQARPRSSRPDHGTRGRRASRRRPGRGPPRRTCSRAGPAGSTRRNSPVREKGSPSGGCISIR